MRAILGLVPLLLAVPSWADVAPELLNRLSDGCATYVICPTTTSTGDCTRGGDEVVLQSHNRSRHFITSHRSTASAYVCDLIASDLGHDAGSGDGQDVSATSISETAPTQSYESLNAPYLWVNCSTITGGNVTITDTLCPAER